MKAQILHLHKWMKNIDLLPTDLGTKLNKIQLVKLKNLKNNVILEFIYN